MKTCIPFIIIAALLTSGCNKKEESKPAPVVKTPAPERKTRPALVPVPPPPDQPAPAEPASLPAGEEVQAFIADLEKLAQEVAQVPKTGPPVADVEELQKSYNALIQRRGALEAGMNAEQRKNLMQSVKPFAKIIGPTLMRLRLAKSVERAKNAKPGTPQADPTLGGLIPQPDGSPPAPPAPPPQ